MAISRPFGFFQHHLLESPRINEKIVLFPISNFGQERIEQYGSIWVIHSLTIYDPPTYRASDPYFSFCGKPTLIIFPIIDPPQRRHIGFPQDSDFSWKYYQSTLRSL